MITEPVVRLRRRARLAGDGRAPVRSSTGARRTRTGPEPPEQSVVYTGTHDNDTRVGWWESLTEHQRAWTELDPADPPGR